jgi:hypothetical protein
MEIKLKPTLAFLLPLTFVIYEVFHENENAYILRIFFTFIMGYSIAYLID